MPIDLARAARGRPTVRGPLIATFTFARAILQPKANGAEFGAGAGSWAVTEFGAAVEFAAAANRLDVLPFARPEAWFGLMPVAEVDAVAFGSGVLVPWDIAEAVVPVSEAARVSLRNTCADGGAPCQIRVHGGDTAVRAGTVIRLYAATL